MNAIFRGFSFLFCASLIIFWPPHASAQSSAANACATLAAKIIPGNPRQGIPSISSIFQQPIRRQVYLKCLQAYAQQGTPGANAVAKPGTFITKAGTFTTFDIPAAVDIGPNGINPVGAITGSYYDGLTFHGFLRTPGGTIITFDPPGSTDTSVGPGGEPFAGPPINPAGSITGYYSDANSVNHGFVRSPGGTFFTIDAPGAVNGTEYLCCITPGGDTAGISFDANFVGHGFLRSRDGTFTAFDPPGSTLTAPSGIAPAGAISGVYFDASGVEHGFLRARDGTITTFNAPGAVSGTQPNGINPAGAIVGIAFDANFVNHGFLRDADGTFTAFDPPGSTAPFGTTAVGINPAGLIVGGYFDGITFHGFLRAPDGTFTTVDPPGSAATGIGGVNPAGVIAGSYTDASGASHGFLFWPNLWASKIN